MFRFTVRVWGMGFKGLGFRVSRFGIGFRFLTRGSERVRSSEAPQTGFEEGLNAAGRVPKYESLLLMIEILSITLRTLNYGNYGMFLIMGHAGFISSNRFSEGSLPPTGACCRRPCIALWFQGLKP